jgi:integrase
MAIRKRTWATAEGEHEAWIADYRARTPDGKVKRFIKTFERRKDAEAYLAKTKIDILDGSYVAPSESVTLEDATKRWLETCPALEPTTVEGYRRDTSYILRLAGHVKLTSITKPAVRKLETALRDAGHSEKTVRRCIKFLGSIFAEAHEQGLCSINPARGLRSRRDSSEAKQAKRHKHKKKLGVDIPRPDEMRAIIEHAPDEFRVLLMLAAFTGLRASEIRALRWANINFAKAELYVRERANQFGVVGSPKSGSSRRTVPLPRALLVALKEWKLRTPGDLVFPPKKASILSLTQIVEHGLKPACIAAGLVTKSGEAKYTGFHSLRHFYASWCIGAASEGGCGLTPKVVQERMGHSTILLTMDTYSHLLPRGNDSVLDDAADRLLGA